MLNCRNVSELLSERLDRKLRPMEGLRLRLHLALCTACARVARQLGFLREAASALPKVMREP